MKFFKFTALFILVCLISLGAVYLYSRYIEPNFLTVTKLDYKNRVSKESLRIVVFGDTHFGELYSLDHLDQIVKKINNENPDLVIFTGDLIGSTGNFVDDPDLISKGLGKIDAIYGKYAVYGNHEYAVSDQYDYEEIMGAGEFEVIVNDWIDIEEKNLRLLGLDDYIRAFPDRNLVDSSKQGAYNILMTHEPDIVDELDLENIQLIVSGHTHGGQIALPFITEKVLPIGGEKYLKGSFELSEETHLFVTRGIGMTQLPFRFMNVPEIVVIDINPIQ